MVAAGEPSSEGAGRAHERGALSITTEARGGRTVLAFAGELDLEDAGRVARALREAVEAPGHAAEADLTQVTFLGSTGVRLLLDAESHARAIGASFAVRLGDGPARRIADLLELERRLDILDRDDPAGGAQGVHIDPRVLARSVDGLGALGTGTASVEEALERVIEATRGLFAVSGVGLMMVDEGGALRYVVATDPAARALETAQEELGEGPCVDCFVLGDMVRTDDIEADGRWTRLTPRVAPHGVRAVLGVPTRLGGAPIGSLNVYRAEPYAWDDSDVAAIEAYNGVLESVLGSAVAARRSGRVVAQLQEALDRRIVIERAVGVLMGRGDMDAVTAFNALRRAARGQRRKVADLAADVLDGAPLPEPPG